MATRDSPTIPASSASPKPAGAFSSPTPTANAAALAEWPDGNEFEVMWRVPREAWGEDEHRGAIRPLDIEREVARFGGETSAPTA